jgi:hypothetical protein
MPNGGRWLLAYLIVPRTCTSLAVVPLASSSCKSNLDARTTNIYSDIGLLLTDVVHRVSRSSSTAAGARG